MFGLVDANNFFASCERVFRPDLNNKPVVVLSNNDGCIIARSQEAKDLGIKMGEPYFKVKKFLEKHGVTVFSANYTLYGDMSRRIFQTLSEFVPDVEIYSIDEAFLDLKNLDYLNLNEFVAGLRQKILKWTGIPVSIGVGKTKTLAKLAAETVKARKINSGVLVLDDPQEIREILRQTPVEELWGIGRRWAKLLYSNFIYSGWDFVNLSDHFIRKKMNVNALKIKYELLGQPAFEMHDLPEAKKSVRRSRSFGELIDNYDDLEEAIANFADSCAVKLRKLGEVANNLMVYIRTDPYRKDLPQYKNSLIVNFKSATNSSRIFIHTAIDALKKIYKHGYKYKKAGVIALGIEPAQAVQMGLFDQYNQGQEQNLMKALDQIRRKYGKSSIKFGSQYGNGNWLPRRHFVSRAYTTDWNQLPEVK